MLHIFLSVFCEERLLCLSDDAVDKDDVDDYIIIAISPERLTGRRAAECPHSSSTTLQERALSYRQQQNTFSCKN